MCSGEILFSFNTLAITDKTDVQISFASCSTQPDFGKNCLNSRCAMPLILPSLSKRIALELVVPWSIDKIYFSILNTPNILYITESLKFHL